MAAERAGILIKIRRIAVQQKERSSLFLFNYFTPGIPKEPFFLLFSHLDSDCFQLFLNEFSAAYPASLNVIQLDNGAFHKAKKLEIPENVVLLFQPAYSPDINPIERVWQYVKKQESWLNFETLADLQKNVCQQLNELCRETIASLTGYPFILSALGKLNL